MNNVIAYAQLMSHIDKRYKQYKHLLDNVPAERIGGGCNPEQLQHIEDQHLSDLVRASFQEKFDIM